MCFMLKVLVYVCVCTFFRGSSSMDVIVCSNTNMNRFCGNKPEKYVPSIWVIRNAIGVMLVERNASCDLFPSSTNMY